MIIMARWGEVVAATIRGIHHIIFFTVRRWRMCWSSPWLVTKEQLGGYQSHYTCGDASKKEMWQHQCLMSL